MKVLRTIGIFSLGISLVLLLVGGGLVLSNGVGSFQNLLEGNTVLLTDIEKHTQTEDISLAEIQTLELHLNAAQVEIVTADVPQMRVEASYMRPISGEKLVTFTRSGSNFSLHFKGNQRSFFHRDWTARTITLTLPLSYTGALRVYANACDMEARTPQVSSVYFDGNACDANMREISGSLTVSVNAGDFDFALCAPGGDVQVEGNACDITVYLPPQANYSISSKVIAGSFVSNGDFEAAGADAPHYNASFRGNAASLKAVLQDNTSN